MKPRELYLVRKPGSRDPRKQPVFVIVSLCAPVYSRPDRLGSQVSAGQDVGLKQDSSAHCDELVSLPKGVLTNYVDELSRSKLKELGGALSIAVGIGGSPLLPDAP